MLRTFVSGVDGFNETVGRIAAWFSFGCVLMCFIVVVLRYAAGTGFVWMQESYVWLHAGLFMVGAGYTFKAGDHVSVDLLYQKFSPRTQAWVDIIGTLVFLFPWLAVITWYSGPFILNAWQILEPSAQAGGLPGLFLLKTMIWIFCAVLALQGAALIARRVLLLRGEDAGPPPPHHAVTDIPRGNP